MRRRNKKVCEVILASSCHTYTPLTPTPLVSVLRNGGALNVPSVTHSDRHIFINDQVFNAEISFSLNNFCAPGIGILFLGIAQLLNNDPHQECRSLKDGTQPGNGCHQLLKLIKNFLSFKPRQSLQLHVQDGLRLDLREGKLRYKAGTCFRWILCTLDQFDDRI